MSFACEYINFTPVYHTYRYHEVPTQGLVIMYPGRWPSYICCREGKPYMMKGKGRNFTPCDVPLRQVQQQIYFSSDKVPPMIPDLHFLGSYQTNKTRCMRSVSKAIKVPNRWCARCVLRQVHLVPYFRRTSDLNDECGWHVACRYIITRTRANFHQ